MTKIFLILIFLFSLFNFFAQGHQSLHFLRIGKKYYVLDREGNLGFNESFERIGVGSDLISSTNISAGGVYLVKKNGKMGVLTNLEKDYYRKPNLAYKIPCIYDSIIYGENNMLNSTLYFVVKNEGKFALFSNQGKQLSDFKYEKLEDLHTYYGEDALFRVRLNGKYQIFVQRGAEGFTPFIPQTADSIIVDDYAVFYNGNTRQIFCITDLNTKQLSYKSLKPTTKKYYWNLDSEIEDFTLVEFDENTSLGNVYSRLDLEFQESRKFSKDEQDMFNPLDDYNGSPLSFDNLGAELIAALAGINLDSLSKVKADKMKKPSLEALEKAIWSQISANKPNKLNPETYQYNITNLGLAPSCDIQIVQEGNQKKANINYKYDKNLTPFTTIKYDEIYFKKDSINYFLKTKLNGKYGLLDLYGNEIFQNHWDSIIYIKRFYPGLIAYKNKQALLFQYNYKLKKLDTLFISTQPILAEFEHLSFIIRDKNKKIISLVKANEKNQNISNSEIIPAHFDSIQKINTIEQCYFSYKGKKVGFYHGKISSIETRFDSITVQYTQKSPSLLLPENALELNKDIQANILAYAHDSLLIYQFKKETFELFTKINLDCKKLRLSKDGNFFYYQNEKGMFQIYNFKGLAVSSLDFKKIEKQTSGFGGVQVITTDNKNALLLFDGRILPEPNLD